ALPVPLVDLVIMMPPAAIVTLVGLAGTPVVALKLAAVLIVVPSAVEIITSGTLSGPVLPWTIGSPWLLATIIPVAPAACALAALVANVTAPRSINTIFPATWAAFVRGVLALFGTA